MAVSLSEPAMAVLRQAIESGLPNGRLAVAVRALEAAVDRAQQGAGEGKKEAEPVAASAGVADPETFLQAFLMPMATQRRALGIVDGPDAQAAFASLQASYQAAARLQ